ncbi:hypothetical protein Pen02_18720 [Plantactinospora endophytica]|uniref:Xaa-Pro dipeptidyl-peptidase C-terminal domain-containing protein n=1 Tax=Plantactinospora endophytica TaxID=673535 RepID=A0ABQ4DWW9_9ACTN|nr:hypothetical protein Pen02_18720 [Plantactinospora endophytica]
MLSLAWADRGCGAGGRRWGERTARPPRVVQPGVTVTFYLSRDIHGDATLRAVVGSGVEVGTYRYGRPPRKPVVLPPRATI